MVKFSKMIDRSKPAKPGISRKSDGKPATLNLRQLSSRRRGQDRPFLKKDIQQGKREVEKRTNLYTQATEYLKLVFSSVKESKLFSLEPGFKILEKIADTRSPIDALFLKAIHDEESYDLVISPSVNVAIYAIKMAENLGFSKNRQIEIGMMGLLHDIGMAKIPKELIYKQSLTDDEFLIFKERPKYGYDILNVFKKEYAYLAECALQIHERTDGTGYPKGLQANEIHEYAQIIGLVDIYEALIHSRPQREKNLHFYAVKEIIKTGKNKFPQKFLKALLNTFSVFPINSYVRLNSGAIGRVIRTYPDQPMRPKVQIIYDSQREKVLTERQINLPDHSLLYILDSVADQELGEMSKASARVTKPGQETMVSGAPSGYSDGSEEKDEQFSGKSVAELQKEQPGKPKSTFLKKGLLIAAGLFFAAGAAWQFLADTPGNGEDAAPEKATVQAPEKAKAVIEKLNLEGAPAKPTRYAAWIGGFSGQQKLDTKIAELSVLGFPTYVMTDNTGIKQLYVGAFYTQKEAEDQYSSLKIAGVESRVVER